MILPVAPLLLPLLTAVLTLLVRHHRTAQQAVAIAGALVSLGAALWLHARVGHAEPITVELGGWAPPFGIILYIDTLSASLAVATAIVHVVVTFYGVVAASEQHRRSSLWPLANTLVMGVQGAFLTGDIFNLYVWFEVLLLSSFVLVALGNERAQIVASAKYVVLNILSSVSFLTAIAMLYGITGTLNLAELSVAVRETDVGPLFSSIAVLFVTGFGIKAAMFPFGLWLPSAYGSPPATIVALLAALLTKVGVYSLLRVGALLFWGVVPWFEPAMLTLGLCSIAIGALGLISQSRAHSVLVHSIVFAVGFMLLGIAGMHPSGVTGTVAYLLSDMMVVTALVLAAGEVERVTGETELSKMGGIYRNYPGLAVVFLVVALSVAGFPPLIGFWAKVALLQGLIEAGQWQIGVAALLGSAVVLLGVSQVWSRGLWKGTTIGERGEGRDLRMAVPVGSLVLLIAAISLVPGPLFSLAERSANQLLDLELYRNVALGGGVPPTGEGHR